MRSPAFRRWLCARHVEVYGRLPDDVDLAIVLLVLELRAEDGARAR